MALIDDIVARLREQATRLRDVRGLATPDDPAKAARQTMTPRAWVMPGGAAAADEAQRTGIGDTMQMIDYNIMVLCADEARGREGMYAAIKSLNTIHDEVLEALVGYVPPGDVHWSPLRFSQSNYDVPDGEVSRVELMMEFATYRTIRAAG